MEGRETVFYSATPRAAAIAWLLGKDGCEGRAWSYSGFFTCNVAPGHETGIKGQLAGPVAFAIRDDFDDTKLYHVNVSKGGEFRAYAQLEAQAGNTTQFWRDRYKEKAFEHYKTLHEDIANHGADFAAKRYMGEE